jgi:GT2 family glycosyltransferase
LLKVGIVTVTFNSAEVLPDFIRSLDQQSHTNFHLYAIDNASSDETLVLLRSWAEPKLSIISNSYNSGVACGNNQGIVAALADGCDLVLLLNNDVVFGPELISLLIKGLQNNDCSMTVPLIYYHVPSNKIWCAGGGFQAKYAARGVHYGVDEIDHGQYNEARRVDYSPTCCTLIKRDVFNKIGFMDERYFVYVDDNDFMYRALKANFKTFYLPEATLWHKVNSLTGTDSPFAQRYLSRNRALFLKKHFDRWTVLEFSLIYRAIYCYRLLSGKDSFAAFKRRQAGWTEGLGIR